MLHALTLTEVGAVGLLLSVAVFVATAVKTAAVPVVARRQRPRR